MSKSEMRRLEVQTKKELKTEVEVGEYKGFPTFTIWELGDRGEKKNLISFGKKKAQALIKYMNEISDFANE